MRLSLMGMWGAAVIAAPAVAAPTPSVGPAAADTRASLPAAKGPVTAKSPAAGPQRPNGIQRSRGGTHAFGCSPP